MRVATLDVTGLKCPLPALLARRALARAGAGEVIEVLSDDPLAAVDVPHMCNQEGFELIGMEQRNAVVRLLLRRPG